MTWQAWVGFVLFYGWLVVMVAFLLVFVIDGARNRKCRDSLPNTGAKCVLRHGHEPDHQARHGTTWPRRRPTWQRMGEEK